MVTVSLSAALALALAAAIALGITAWRLKSSLVSLRRRFAPVTDVDAEIERLRREHGELLKKAEAEATAFSEEQRARRDSLTREYDAAYAVYTKLKSEIDCLEETANLQAVGLYKPHFDFCSSEQYKAELEIRREKAKAMVKADQAVYCSQTWAVNNNVREGQRMVKLYKRLMLRAFNGECDAALADVTWSNVSRMEDRVCRTFRALNGLGEVIHVAIYNTYLDVRLEELRLKNEYEQKRYQEREEQRRIREQIREEERAQRELEQASEEAAAEEARYQRALEAAREQAQTAVGAQLQRLTEQVSRFEVKLDEARKKKKRAISRAQLTKSGFVYVISNFGSFGERVFKIGMTRRLEPMDRIYELSGASVPFPYDLHAMLYSDDAAGAGRGIAPIVRRKAAQFSQRAPRVLLDARTRGDRSIRQAKRSQRTIHKGAGGSRVSPDAEYPGEE